MSVGVYIPVKDNAHWCRDVDLIPGLDYVAVDNCSTDGSGDILDRRGVTVHRQSRPVDRVGNWRECIERFLASDHEWLKWQFAGDTLSSRAGALIDEAINACPQARLIVFDYDMVGPSATRRLAAVGETRLIHPPEAMARAALHCNWFGAPLGHLVHRDALSNGYEFGSLPWVADMWFCIEIAMRLPVLAVDVPIGTFNMAQRAYHTRYAHSLEASLEEGLARSRAADHYLAITGDQSGYRQLRQVIEQSTIAAINDRAFARNASEATQVRTAA